MAVERYLVVDIHAQHWYLLGLVIEESPQDNLPLLADCVLTNYTTSPEFDTIPERESYYRGVAATLGYRLGELCSYAWQGVITWKLEPVTMQDQLPMEG